ncbi:hypothetical protein ACWTQZ_25580, partial [Escherichia coli]
RARPGATIVAGPKRGSWRILSAGLSRFMPIFCLETQKTGQRRLLAILPKWGFSSIMPALLFANLL